jgi:hypothetical protein
MVRSRVVEIILQRQTSQRKQGMPLDWDADLRRLARDPSLSTDHRIRVGIHKGEWIIVQITLDTQEVQGVPQVDGGPDACGQEGSPSPS